MAAPPIDRRNKARTRNAAFGIWTALYLGVITGIGAIGWLVLLPNYQSPDSRLWSSSLGYPAYLRAVGRPIPVPVTTADRQTMVQSVSAVGVMAFMHAVPVNVEVGGIVTDVLVELGQWVNRGDVLLTLDTGGHRWRIAELDVEMRRADYAQARADLEREADAHGRGLIALTQLREFERAHRTAEIALRRAEETLVDVTRSRSTSALARSHGDPAAFAIQQDGQLAVLALRDGWISELRVDGGENLVSAQSSLMAIGNRLAFEGAVDQIYFGRISTGDVAEVYLWARPGQRLTGRVVRVGPTIRQAQVARTSLQPAHTFSIWVEIDALSDAAPETDDDTRDLAPGMNGYARLDYDVNAVTVPDSALMRYSGGQGVVLVVSGDEMLEVRPVTYSVGREGMVAIVRGLAAGERVVVSGQTGLSAGDRVVTR